MPSFLAENAHYLLLGIIGFWFAARFLVRPGGRGEGLGAIFRRERAIEPGGLDDAAIRTLVDDSVEFARIRPDLRGLLLAGPFAGGTAGPDSLVTLIFLADSLATYASKEALASWPYPGRDHPVLKHELDTDGTIALHHLSLRGAPPIAMAFVHPGQASLPTALAPSVTGGLKRLDDPAGQARVLQAAWREQA